MLVFGNPACHPRPIRASQVFLLEVNIKDVGYIGWGWGLQEQWGWAEIVLQKAETDREKERERAREKALAASSRAESQDSKGDFHIMILQQCIAYFKDLITTAY